MLLIAKNESAEHTILRENSFVLNKFKSKTGDSTVFCKYINTVKETMDTINPNIIYLSV